MIGAFLSLLLFGIVGIVVIGVVMAVLGIMFSLALGLVGVLLFKVAPLLLIGWVVLKLVGRSRRPSRLSTADQRWLDG